MVGIPGYDWQDEEVELTRGKWPGYLAMPDLLATGRRDSVAKKKSFQKQALQCLGRWQTLPGERWEARANEPELPF